MSEVNAVDAFEMGYWFGMSLRGQVMEDSRAVGRLLTADIFEPLEAAISAEILDGGFNSFEDADAGIVRCKQIIRAALIAHGIPAAPTLSEIRDAWAEILQRRRQSKDDAERAIVYPAIDVWRKLDAALKQVGR